MFLKKVTIKQKGKTYNYYKIVASYRDKDGKPKHRLIQNLGVLSEVDAERMRLILPIFILSYSVLILLLGKDFSMTLLLHIWKAANVSLLNWGIPVTTDQTWSRS